MFASLLLLATSAAPAADRDVVTLAFVAKDQPLSGIAYGIDAVDGQRSAYGQKVSVRLLAGRRTVWYSCPGEAAPAGGSRMSFDFEARGSYELSCRSGQEAIIRRTEGC